MADPPQLPASSSASGAASAPGGAASSGGSGSGSGSSGGGGSSKSRRRKKRRGKKKGAAAVAPPPLPPPATTTTTTTTPTTTTTDSQTAASTTASASAPSQASGAGGGAGALAGQTLTRDGMMQLLAQSMRETALSSGMERPKHKFWGTQPVPALGESVSSHGPIDEPKTVDDVRKEPLPMLAGFEWCTVDIQDPEQRAEVYKLLSKNYVEGGKSVFRFDYSQEFLLWALTPPGYHKEWHVGLRQSNNKRLRALITGVPARVHVYDHDMDMCEINFLCVHKGLRSKRLAPVLIQEVTRRVNLKGVWQAVYTAGVVLPKPVATCKYFHRSLNPIKLLDVGFSHLRPRMTRNRTAKLFKLPSDTVTPGLRPMEAKDVKAVAALLRTYLSKFALWSEWDDTEAAHWLLPRANVIDSFVVQSDDGTITDFCSFYHLPSSIIGHQKHKTLFAAYSYYNVALKTPLKQLMHDMLIVAKKRGCDVFNALNLMDNEPIFKDLLFASGDGNLRYYLYNWGCPDMQANKMALVLM